MIIVTVSDDNREVEFAIPELGVLRRALANCGRELGGSAVLPQDWDRRVQDSKLEWHLLRGRAILQMALRQP